MTTTETSKWATLRNGRRVVIRPIRPTDGLALVAFHEGLSDESKRMRFFSCHPHLSASEVERFTHVDRTDRDALVALSLDKIVGVGRFDRTGPETAEVAFVVTDNWQRLGLAPQLLERLANLAVAVGISRLDADTLGDNRKMLRVFARCSPDRVVSFDDGIIHVEMPIGDGHLAGSRS